MTGVQTCALPIYTCRVAALWMARSRRTPLTKGAYVVELKTVAVEVQQRILQDRSMTVAENESITIGPQRLTRIMFHYSAVQHMGEWCERHRRALVATLGGQWRIHRHTANHRHGETIVVC